MNKSITKSQLLNIVLIVMLVIVAGFGYLYYKKTNIVTAINQVVPTVSDTPQQPDYLFSIYGSDNDFFDHPRSITVWDSKIYVADTLHGRVMVFDYNGKYLQTIGGRGKFAGAMRMPSEIAVFNNQLYVTDYELGKIGIYTLNGNFIGYFAEKVFKSPLNIKVAGDKFYVLDSLPQKIYILDPKGNILKSFGNQGGKQGELYFADGINVDKDGNIYVADSNNFRIQVFTPDGKAKAVWKSDKKDNSDGYTVPRGIAFDQKGYIYTANGLAGGVTVSDSSGKRLALFTQGESRDDTLTLPNSVFIDENNKLYITEYGRSRILVYQIK